MDTQPTQKFRILHVDDTDLVRDAVRSAFEIAGYHVTSASSAEEALAIMCSEGVGAFDLVISDDSMDGLDGLALFTELSILRYLGKRAVFSTQLTPNKIELYKKVGVELFIEKPLSLQLFLIQVGELLRE